MHQQGSSSPVWVKSSLSFANGNCVEVADLGGVTGIRDSKDPGGPVLRYTPFEWAALLSKVRAGKLFASGDQVVNFYGPGTGPDRDNPVLRFTAAEWEAFTGGVFAGEFDRFGV